MTDAARTEAVDPDRLEAASGGTLSGRLPGFAVGVVRWSFAVVVFVATLELCIRVEDTLRWGAPLLGTYSHDGLFVADSIGWHPRPGASYQKWTINDEGFRGPEITRKKPAGVVRVAVLGSSETFGQAESPGGEFPRALERHLNSGDAHTRFEVVNAGIPGMSVARMTEYWKRWVSAFEPDIVVVYPSPTFYLSNQVPPDASDALAAPAAPPPPRLRLPGKVREAVNRFLPESVESWIKRALIERTAARHGPGWVWQTVPEERLEAYQRHVLQLATVIRQSGAEPVFVTHVSAVERPFDARDRITLLAWRKFYPRAPGDVLIDFEDRANQALAEAGARAGFRVVRLQDAVAASPRNFSDQIHFTDAGAELVARELAQAILGRAPREVDSGR